MRQRGARLSFLGGKTRGTQQSNGETTTFTHATGESSESNSQYSKSKENLSRVLQTQSIDTNSSINAYHRNCSADVTSSPSIVDRSGKSRETVDIVEGDLSRSEGGVLRIRSVRKRLSILKLGKKPSKSNGITGVVSEEQ